MSSYQGGPFAQFNQIGYRSVVDEMTLARFFNAVYAWMCVGLAITAIAAYGTYLFGSQVPHLFNRVTQIVLVVISFGLVIAISSAINKISTPVATALFLLYAVVMGVMLSSIFANYSHWALSVAFLETAGAFGAMSLYGMITKRDLSRLGSLLFMALIGIIIASVVNMFLGSPLLYWIISYAGVAIFVGLTAFDTQRLKMIADQTRGDPALASRMAIVGSLTLYLDFLNLFLFILRMFNGGRRD
jgi:FtsH-binding integral membrane protein